MATNFDLAAATRRADTARLLRETIAPLLRNLAEGAKIASEQTILRNAVGAGDTIRYIRFTLHEIDAALAGITPDEPLDPRKGLTK